MKKNLRPIAALFAACAMLTSGAMRIQADTPRQAAINAAAQAKSAIDAARKAHAEAEKAGKDKAKDAGEKIEAEEKALEQAQAALKAAQQALAAIPEGQDLTTQKKVGDELDELDAILKVLGFIELNGLDVVIAFVPPGDAEAKRKAQEAVNKAFDEIEKAIKKLPPENRKNLQKQIEDRQKELLGHLALGALPGKATNTYASLVMPSSTVSEGLRIVTFDTLEGRVIVNLPDDMRAGDTISGTVVAEPKGQTPEERARNMTGLSGYVIELEPPKKPDGTSNPKVTITAQVAPAPSPSQFTLTLPLTFIPGPPTPTMTNVSSANSTGLGITLTNTTGSFTIGGTTTVPIEMVSLNLQSVEPLKVPQLPTIGQQGRPIEIYGPFDGNSSNTKLMYGPAGSSIQDFEKNTENVTGGFGLLQPLAESPRKGVFQAPVNLTGPLELYWYHVKTPETTAPYRSVGVNLTAPKTNLLKGESTELHVEVNGLQGITKPVPLTLESHGVITMEGGMYQPLMIQPSQVGADGRYTTTRGVTGVQTGVWSATVTVVTHRFDVCLQDDSNPGNVVFVNTFKGDYIFTPSGGTSLGGTGTVTRKDCIITLTDSQPDRKVQGNIDPCTKTGSASVQASPPNKPKITFTITDRNTANNTCTCGPGCK